MAVTRTSTHPHLLVAIRGRVGGLHSLRAVCRGREEELFSGLKLKYSDARKRATQDEGSYELAAAKVLAGGKLLERLLEVTACASSEGELALL